MRYSLTVHRIMLTIRCPLQGAGVGVVGFSQVFLKNFKNLREEAGSVRIEEKTHKRRRTALTLNFEGSRQVSPQNGG